MSRVMEVGNGRRRFMCPACKTGHEVNDGWSFNGDYERPTFAPSIRVIYDGADAGRDGAPPARCHSFVTGGVIAFCGDSTHAMAGMVVALGEVASD